MNLSGTVVHSFFDLSHRAHVCWCRWYLSHGCLATYRCAVLTCRCLVVGVCLVRVASSTDGTYGVVCSRGSLHKSMPSLEKLVAPSSTTLRKSPFHHPNGGVTRATFSRFRNGCRCRYQMSFVCGLFSILRPFMLLGSRNVARRTQFAISHKRG